jgi:hypothetical protein
MRSLRALAWAASVGAVSACAAAPSATFTIRGTYAIYGEHFGVSGSRCVGTGDARGIGDGTPVAVTDTDNIVLATAALHGGSYTTGIACRFRLDVAGVADGRGYYRLVIGGQRVEQFSSAEAHRPLSLTWYAQ